tara:strand:- start:77 stop:634 length:558 start_codon:yes stop_codon:yes gene_type:complete
MKTNGFPELAALMLLLSTACVESETEQGTTPAVETKRPSLPRLVPGQAYLDQAQPKLRTIKLWLGAAELKTEIARSQTEIATGMMYRKGMAEEEAMIFVFPRPFQASFYMRNTVLPLSCAYIGPDGTILEIHDMKPLEEKPIVAGTDQVQYVLEVNQGWFQRHQIQEGAVIRAEKGTLSNVFFAR